MNRDNFYQEEQTRSVKRAGPPALPSGLLFSSSKMKVMSPNRPMSFRVKNEEYEAQVEPVIEDLAYQITLENDLYSPPQTSMRASNGRRPQNMLKVEKSRGLFAHIEDSDFD